MSRRIRPHKYVGTGDPYIDRVVRRERLAYKRLWDGSGRLRICAPIRQPRKIKKDIKKRQLDYLGRQYTMTMLKGVSPMHYAMVWRDMQPIWIMGELTRKNEEK